MKTSWSTVVFPIAGLYACRILGLFLLIPVFTLFASQFAGATPQNIGIAFGIYGLAQACMQIPFGLLSDRFGRKRMISLGLMLLLFGSLLGAWTHSIWGMILARTIQGIGAIGSVLLALLGDLTPTGDRAKAMAIIGVSIGVSFSLAMMLSPFITQFFGLAGIFYLIAILASLGLILLHTVIPVHAQASHPEPTKFLLKSLGRDLLDPQLQKLNIGIGIQHACLTAMFYVLPLRLKTFVLMGKLTVSWHFYVPVVFFSFLCMAPIIYFAEKKQHLDLVLKGSILVLAASQLCLSAYSTTWLGLIGNVFIYFIAFNLLEAILPSQISKCVNTERRGGAMGIYSTCQFFGIFAGATLAGWLYPRWGDIGIFNMNAMLCALWFFISLKRTG